MSLFLRAEWRHLLMLNYEIEPALLEPYVPRGTCIDSWQGRTYVSLVGFRFLDTRLMGFHVPFHRDFAEVNLRFYVAREVEGERRRGVVFIREIVPKPAVALTARLFYNENYISLPMTHEIVSSDQEQPEVRSLRYGWRYRGESCSIRGIATGGAVNLDASSEEAFIVEHYWGYARQRNGGTVEYQVEHEPWQRVWPCATGVFEGDPAALYGNRFREVLRRPPSSTFIAGGSPVVVHRGRRIET